ncbi:hypothetical protein F4860DRAFT_511846 [Xylaria cubensis]|nr:hypothetical protein F4860DRAFT_511846 [Xylaria cubensis]
MRLVMSAYCWYLPHYYFGDEDDDPLPVDIEPVTETPVIVELGKRVSEEVELGGISVPVTPVQLEKVDTFSEIVVVDDDWVPESDAERVDVSAPEIGCEFVDVDDAPGVEAGFEPEGIVFVPLGDESPVEDDCVTDPGADVGVVAPELVPDTSVDILQVLDDHVLVVVTFPGTPDVQLEVTTVVLEFENVIEAVVIVVGVVGVLVFVVLPFVELWMIDIVDIIGTPFVSVLVTVVRISELEDVLLTVVDPEFVIVVLSPGVGPLAPEVVVEAVCVEPVIGPTEVLVIGVPALSEPVEELPLLIGVVEIELDELLLALFDAVIELDDPRLVVVPEGIEKVSEMMDVVILEIGPLEVGDVVSVFEAVLEEERVDTPEVCVPEVDEPDKLVIDSLPPVGKEEVKLVGSVVIEFVNDGEPDDQGELPEIELRVVKKIVDVVSQTGTVTLPEIVVIAETLVPVTALLAVDPERGFEDVDHDEPEPPGGTVNAVGMLLGGGSVKPG